MTRAELRTERLVLSPPTEADIDAIAEICADPGIARWVPIPSPYSRDDAAWFVGDMAAQRAAGTAFSWIIRRDGVVIGEISVHSVAAGKGAIGYWLHEDARGQKILPEAGAAVIDWAFAAAPEGLGLARIDWYANGGNIVSAHIARALGFRYEGIARSGDVHRGVRVDRWLGGLLPGDKRTPQPWPDALLGA